MPLLETYEKFLSTLQLNPQHKHVQSLEMDLRGDLNPSLWMDEFFFERGKWLTFEGFAQAYVAENEPLLLRQFPDLHTEALQAGLKARLYRTQFGMLTEYHAYFLFQRVFGAQALRRDKQIDRRGVDFQLDFEQKIYNIHIFSDTLRAWAFRAEKIKHKESNSLAGVHVNLPYAIRAERFNSLFFLPNGFGIFTRSYLEYFKQELLAGRILNDNIRKTTAKGFVYEF